MKADESNFLNALRAALQSLRIDTDMLSFVVRPGSVIVDITSSDLAALVSCQPGGGGGRGFILGDVDVVVLGNLHDLFLFAVLQSAIEEQASAGSVVVEYATLMVSAAMLTTGPTGAPSSGGSSSSNVALIIGIGAGALLMVLAVGIIIFKRSTRESRVEAVRLTQISSTDLGQTYDFTNLESSAVPFTAFSSGAPHPVSSKC